MMKILIPLILLVLGLGGGVGAGLFLIPQDEEKPGLNAVETTETTTDTPQMACDTNTHKTDLSELPEGEKVELKYAAFSNQFVVPVVISGEVKSIMILNLSLEIPKDNLKDFRTFEPKLRDLFLRTLFDHANTGGFNDRFTSATNMRILRKELLNAAQSTLGSKIARDILVLDIMRRKA